MRYDYQGKLILLTGASSGLGRCLAKVFAQEGAHLALVARREEPLKNLIEETRGSKGKIFYFPFDLEKTTLIPQLLNQVTERFHHPVDVLVHCAGSSCYGEIERIPFDNIE